MFHPPVQVGSLPEDSVFKHKWLHGFTVGTGERVLWDGSHFSSYSRNLLKVNAIIICSQHSKYFTQSSVS